MKKLFILMLILLATTISPSVFAFEDCFTVMVSGMPLNHCASATTAVPELNAAGAPVAFLLIAGLIALGFEQRRKSQL